ncbi:hypothetical protein DOE67_15860, partial [Listeria monocytogenes]|nr:hypothetical protein [Listeria monocytogenes]
TQGETKIQASFCEFNCKSMVKEKPTVMSSKLELTKTVSYKIIFKLIISQKWRYENEEIFK